MERSAIRDYSIRGRTAPDCAALHPGYKDFYFPKSSRIFAWIFAIPEIQRS